MKFRFPLILGLVSVLSLAAPGENKLRNRVLQNVDNSRLALVKGNVHRLARADYDAGRAASSLQMQRVTMVFKPSPSQQTDLDSLLKEQSDPSAPNYHKWLTAAQFGQRFGISDDDLAKVTDWLQSQGLVLVDTPASRTSVTFSGTAAQISSAFRTEIHNYIVGGQKHYANATEPAIPAAFADIVIGFRALNNFLPKPRHIKSRRVNPNFTSNLSGNHYLSPDDVATIYNIKGLYSAGYDGTGQKIVVVGQTDIVASDIAAFRSASGLPAKQPTVALVPGSSDPGIVSGDIEEANLDIQWAGSIAKNATIIYVNSNNGAFDSLQYAIENNLAPVISVSYGSCEANFTASEIAILTLWGQQANVQGITISAASGDSGAADCDYDGVVATRGLAVDIPAALPYVTGIGGTTFNEGTDTYWSTTNNSNSGSALSYIPEVAWNDTTSQNGLSSTGGGKSTAFSRPSWQTGMGVPDGSFRAVPDISFAASGAHDGYLVCSQGSCVNGYRDADDYLTVLGGTSAGAPVFAGILALVNHKTGSPLGNVNPTLYTLAASTTGAFHDITSGNNAVPCAVGTNDCGSAGNIGYTAGAGYDLATGLGSVDAFVLASAWSGGTAANPDFQLTTTVSTMNLGSGGSGTSTVTATALNGFDGAITWSCSVSSGLAGSAECNVFPDALNPNSQAVLTVKAVRQSAGVRARGKSRFASWLAVSGFPLGVFLVGGTLRKSALAKTRLRILAALLATAGLLGTIACGGGGSTSTNSNDSSSSSVTGTVTVVASSGTNSHSVGVMVTLR